MIEFSNDMIVISIVGAPCTGKSVLMADLFSHFKKKHKKCEMAFEVAKNMVYENDKFSLNNQIKVFTKQLMCLRRLKKKTDIVVTDSPILLSLVYSKEKNPYFKDMVLWEFNQYKNIIYYLDRSEEIKYQKEGRTQTEEESKTIGMKILNILEEKNIEYKRVNLLNSFDTIVKDLEKYDI